jgi:pseudouridine-5'-phosphate glycosidase
MQPFFEYSKEVADAIKQKKPLLALESTLITHGLPYPHNLEIAQASEQIARDMGVVPATIALMNGKIKIGVTADELEKLSTNKNCVKATTRDISYVLSKKINAGTTVAATLFCAHNAGIRVFATGGIGGVHRGTDNDVSADLLEISRIPMAIVCAGAKSILDLPRTLEHLETLGVPVIGYRTDVLPAFYSASSTHKLTCHVNDMPSLAAIAKTHWDLRMQTGLLIANPIPMEDEIPMSDIEPVIENALAQAKADNISGKDMTPYLLAHIRGISHGSKVLTANISLIKNNVRVGAELALAIL